LYYLADQLQSGVCRGLPLVFLILFSVPFSYANY